MDRCFVFNRHFRPGEIVASPVAFPHPKEKAENKIRNIAKQNIWGQKKKQY